MKFVEKAKLFAAASQKRTELLGDVIGAVLGDPASVVKGETSDIRRSDVRF